MAVNPLLYKINFLYFLLGILVLAGIQVFGVSEFLNFKVAIAAIDAAVSWLLLGALIYGIINTLSFFHPNHGKFILVLFVPLMLAWLWLKSSTWINLFFISEGDYQVFVIDSQFYRFTVTYLLLVGSMGFSLLWYRLGEKEEEQRRKEETDRIAKEAELFKLRQQLQPHFLFNSLNSVNSLIGSRPGEARNMVQQLSEFLRGTMRREEQKFISLKEELDYLKLYLDIEQVRFGHRLKVKIDCEEDQEVWKVPPLILQPVLENAIKFGLYGTVDDLLIEVNCKATENYLLLSISNPFDEDSQPSSGTGFGLRSIRRRLYLLYARTDLLEVSASGTIFHVNIKIPKIYDQSTNN